jgi:general stress protein YciG
MARLPATTKIRIPAVHADARFADLPEASCRMETALRRAAIVRLGDLDGRPVRDIARVHGVGRKTLPELIGLLADMGALDPPRVEAARAAPTVETPIAEFALTREPVCDAASSSTNSDAPRRPHGFAALDPERLREISRLGGRAVHAPGNGGHKFAPAEARVAGSKGGTVSAQNRKQVTHRPGTT